MSRRQCQKINCSGKLNKVKDLNRGEVRVCASCGKRYSLDGEML